MATKSDPKQIDPKLVVSARMVLPITPAEQHPSSFENHHPPTVPATMTCVVF